MAGRDLDCMTLEEVGEWLASKGLQQDIVDQFVGRYIYSIKIGSPVMAPAP